MAFLEKTPQGTYNLFSDWSHPSAMLPAAGPDAPELGPGASVLDRVTAALTAVLGRTSATAQDDADKMEVLQVSVFERMGAADVPALDAATRSLFLTSHGPMKQEAARAMLFKMKIAARRSRAS